MSYSTFLLKKIWKNKLNIIPLLIAIAFLIFMYFSYHRISYHEMTDPEFSGERQIEKITEDILGFQKVIDNPENSENFRESAKRNLKMAETRLELLQKRLVAFQSENWHEFYNNDKELDNITLQVVRTDSAQYDEEFIKVLELNTKYDQFMIDHHLGFDSRFGYVQGVSFMTKVLNDYFPIIGAVLFIFISSRIFCSSYLEKMSIHDLLPIPYLKKQGSRIFAGIIAGLLILIVISFTALICGTVGNTLGNLNSPILTYTSQGADTYIPFISIFPQYSILFVLSLSFIIAFISVISIFIRKNLPCMMVSLVLIVGCIVIVPEIAPLQEYLHLLPTTYVSSLRIISGAFAYSAANININFSNGIIVLIISNVILLGMYYYVPKIKAKV